MSNHGKTLPVRWLAPVATSVPEPRRINVAVNEAMIAAIDRVIDDDKVTLTEAVRRLIALGGLVHEVIKVRKAKLIIRDDQDGDREILFF